MARTQRTTRPTPAASDRGRRRAASSARQIRRRRGGALIQAAAGGARARGPRPCGSCERHAQLRAAWTTVCSPSPPVPKRRWMTSSSSSELLEAASRREVGLWTSRLDVRLLDGNQRTQRGLAVLADAWSRLASERSATQPLDLVELQLGAAASRRSAARRARRSARARPRDLARALRTWRAGGSSGPCCRGPLQRLADPDRRVGGEAVALALVELLGRADQAEHALLDEVVHGQALALVLASDGTTRRRLELTSGPWRRGRPARCAWRARSPRWDAAAGSAKRDEAGHPGDLRT